ncbi:MAG: PPC domain-containing protein [Phormidesmis sp.]
MAHQSALAQTLLQQQGMLAPMQDAYTFEGESGAVMTIELKSEEFDTLLVLKGPDGEVITSNDDYGGTLNSTIVLKLPTSGEYSAIASSFAGDGGNYQIEVRPASEYEQVFSRAYDLSLSEKYADSIEAYTAAIELNDTDPGAYLGRAESVIGQAYLTTSNTGNTSPNDLPRDVIDKVVADFLKAADLLEQSGQTGPADSLREQAQYFLGESPEASPPPSVEPSAPIPVEPNGGIGDGATPLPEPAPGTAE